jgi:flagellar biosynthesis protein FlhF
MELRTFRAATMYEALAMVRRELGPDAAVLHTRTVPTRRLLGWLAGPPQIEVTASCGVNVPSRFPAVGWQPAQGRFDAADEAGWEAAAEEEEPLADDDRAGGTSLRAANGVLSRPDTPFAAQGHATQTANVNQQLSQLQAMVQDLYRRSQPGRRPDLPEELFCLFTELLDAEVSEELARELVDRLRSEARGPRPGDPAAARARIARMIEAEIAVSGPIRLTPGRCRLVALVGPTGVGKTTTIAKLAAQFRLKEKRRVGLITVDTYRIAAVEQLRTYAEIIDLPMQVVATPREMREAVRRMEQLDLLLLDTAGRSPKDDIRIQELRAFLSEAAADEVHLVLSSVAGARALEQAAERFAAVGTTALLLTKLDEAAGLGNILPLLRSSKLPLSYLTNGQNVPDDIEIADAGRLARLILTPAGAGGRQKAMEHA